MPPIILAELLHSPSSTKTCFWGRCATFKRKRSPAPPLTLGLLSWVSTNGMTLGVGLRSENYWGFSPKQTSQLEIFAQRYNMKGLPQTPWLVTWLSRHLSGLVRMDILDALRPGKPQKLPFYYCQCHYFKGSYPGYWWWIQPYQPSSQLRYSISGSFPESGPFIFFNFFSDVSIVFVLFFSICIICNSVLSFKEMILQKSLMFLCAFILMIITVQGRTPLFSLSSICSQVVTKVRTTGCSFSDGLAVD